MLVSILSVCDSLITALLHEVFMAAFTFGIHDSSNGPLSLLVLPGSQLLRALQTFVCCFPTDLNFIMLA